MSGRDGVVVGSGVSTEPDAAAAARAACEDAATGLAGASADLVVVFVTPDHAGAAADVAAAVHEILAPGALIGCTAQGVVAGMREIERPPAITVWAAHLPGTTLETFHLTFEREDGGGAFRGWPAAIPSGAAVLLLGDPTTIPAEAFLKGLAEASDPPPLVVGGMASGGMRPGENRLFLDEVVTNAGAAGVVVSGRVAVRAIVSQGCRPVGIASTITRSERNVVLELAGKPPLERLRETFAEATPDERALMQRSVDVGIVIDEHKAEFGRGDFLIRGVIGADQETGALALGDMIGVGDTVQFHVRDAASADEDLRELLAQVTERPAGALLFTCNGRGSRMFSTPDHDAGVIQQAFGGMPLAGFFCAGEIGPVGGKPFLHGFTASIALLVDTQAG